MSFSGNVKKELSEINIFSNTDVMKYELYGYILCSLLEDSLLFFSPKLVFKYKSKDK